MGFQVDSNPSTAYVSAPSSPCRTSPSEISSFCTAPGSPTHGLTASKYSSGWEFGPDLIKGAKTDSHSDSDSFEFGTCRRFEENLHQYHQQLGRRPQQQQRGRIGEQIPAVSYADELFSNGQVLPLKPPPCLQFVSNQSPRISSHRSTSSVLFAPFKGLSLQNKEFNPFMVALENVKREETPSVQLTPQWKSRSFSKIRSSCSAKVQDHNNEMGHLELPIGQGQDVPRRPIKPTRSASERYTGPMRWAGPESHVNPTITTLEAATDAALPSIMVTRCWRSFPKGSKRRVVRDFLLLRSASQGRADPKDKLRNRTAALRNTKDRERNKPHHYCSDQKIKSKQVHDGLIKNYKAPMPQNPGLFGCLGLSS